MTWISSFIIRRSCSFCRGSWRSERWSCRGWRTITDFRWRATTGPREEREVGDVLITVWELRVSLTLILQKGFKRIRQIDVSHSNNNRTPLERPSWRNNECLAFIWISTLISSSLTSILYSLNHNEVIWNLTPYLSVCGLPYQTYLTVPLLPPSADLILSTRMEECRLFKGGVSCTCQLVNTRRTV